MPMQRRAKSILRLAIDVTILTGDFVFLQAILLCVQTIRFKDLDIFQIGIHGRTTLGYNFYVRGNAYWGWILDGDYKRGFATSFRR